MLIIEPGQLLYRERYTMTNEQTIDERLKNHPHLRERFNRILDLTEGKSEGPDTADEVEERAIIELQKLGQEVMTQWGVDKAKKEINRHKKSNPSAKTHKKK